MKTFKIQDKPGFPIFLIFALGLYIAFESHPVFNFFLLIIPVLCLTFLFYAALTKMKVSAGLFFIIFCISILTLGINKGISHLPDRQAINELSGSSSALSLEFSVIETLKSSERWNKFIAQPLDLDPFNSLWLIYYPREMDSVTILAGDKLLISAQPIVHSPNPNPLLFDYNDYLMKKGVYITCFVKNPEDIVHIPSSEFSISGFFNRFRDQMESLIDSHYQNPRHAAFQKAILLGVSDELDDELMLEFRKSGAIHVLAISGLHVGIVAGILLFLINLIVGKSRKWLRLALLFAGIWSFVLIAGMRPSVFRAGLMFSVYFFGIVIDRKIKAHQALGLAGLIILLHDPKCIYNLGFQLSFAAVFGIVTFYPYLKAIFPFNNKVIRFLWDGLAVALAAQIATLPILLYSFKEISMVFWLSGIIVVPVMSVLLPLSLLQMILIPFSALLSTWTGKAVGWVMDFMIGLNQIISNLDFAFIKSLPFDGIMMVLSILIIVFLAFHMEAGTNKFAIAATACLVFLFVYNFYGLISCRTQNRIIQYADSKNITFQLLTGNRACNFFTAPPDYNLTSAFKFNAIHYRISNSSDTIDLADKAIFPVKIGEFLWLSDSTEIPGIDQSEDFRAIFLHKDILQVKPENLNPISTEELVFPAGLPSETIGVWKKYGVERNLKLLFQDETGQVVYNF